MLVHMGGGIAQGAERMHLGEGGPALAGQAAIHALWFVDDQYRAGFPYQIDGFIAASLLALLVEVVHILLVDGSDSYHHDLDVGTGGVITYLSRLAGIVEEIFKRGIGVEAPKVIFHDLEGFVDTLLDGHRGDDDDELGEAVAPVQLENSAQVDVGLAGAGLHFHREITRCEAGGWTQAVASLHLLKIIVDFIVKQFQTVSNTQCTLLGESLPIRIHRS